jgi:hypothetical protein
MSTQNKAYPVNIRGELTIPPGGGWWLLKWLLIIPHLIVLCFLWIGFVFSWIISLVNIVFTGKYPESFFKYNVGVLRWTWRVGFYSYEALGTDKYPPFSLDPNPDYPADLEVDYPEKLSPGLALIKWWLLAIPHYIIVGFFQGGWGRGNVGLVTVLAVFAIIVVLFKGTYPPEFFKLVMGLNRWSIRVAAYTALMTDEYPPFRLWDD